MKRIAIILTALLAVTLATSAPALGASKPKKSAPKMMNVVVDVQTLSGGTCQAGGWTVNHMVRYGKTANPKGLVSCKPTPVGRYKVGQYARVCLVGQDGWDRLGTECRTQRVGRGMKPFVFILNGKAATAGSGSSGGGGSQSQGAAQGANTEQAQACKSGDQSACSNNANANTNQNTQQQQTQVTQQTTVIVNVPAAPAPPAPTVSFLNVPAHRVTGSASNPGTENYCVQTANATSVTVSNSVAQATVGPVQDKGAGKFCFDYTPMQTSLFPAGFTVVWDTLTATATGPGGSATATASIQLVKPPM